MRAPCHKTMKFPLEGISRERGSGWVFLVPSVLLPLAPSRDSGSACTLYQDRWLWGSGAGVSHNLCLPSAVVPECQPQGSGSLPETPGWKPEGGHLCPYPPETWEGLFLLCLSPAPAPSRVPTAHLFGIWQQKDAVFIPAPSPTHWQLLACSLCPDMAEGHWLLGDGADFLFGSGEDGGGGLATPWVRGEGRDASLDKRQREKETSPTWGWGHCIKLGGGAGLHLCVKPVVPALTWPGSPFRSPWTSVPANQ